MDLEGIARRTPGFSGASLQNLLNEAAIYAVRQGKKGIGYEEIDAAVDRQVRQGTLSKYKPPPPRASRLTLLMSTAYFSSLSLRDCSS